jgi:hypothetical protein
MKYKNMPSLGHVFLVDNKDIDFIGQHLGYAYVFNNSGQLINEMGQLVRPFGVVSEIDINNDGVTDLTIKQGNLLNYFSTFISDCFGDNYSEAATATASQGSAANFSLNSLS